MARAAWGKKKESLSAHLPCGLRGSRRRVKKVHIFRAWFSHGSGAVPALETFGLSLEETFFSPELFCEEVRKP